MRRLKKFGLLAMALACAGLMAPVAGAATIDDFIGTHSVTTDTGSPAYSGLTGLSNFGGTRELYVERINILAPPAVQDTMLSIAVDTPPGAGSSEAANFVSNNSSSPDYLNGSIAHITWDGDTSPASQGTNITTNTVLGSLLVGGNTQFYVNTNPHTELREMRIDVWSWDGSAATTAYSNWVLAASTEHHYLNFSNFAGVDFGNVSAIRMTFLTDDITLNTFGVVPVPPAVGLGLLGMMVVGGLRRRKKASAA